MTDWLLEDPRVVNAARVGAAFGMDPVAVLNGSRAQYSIRVAAAMVVNRDRQQARQQALRDQPKRR